MSALVKVTFYGDQLYAIRNDDDSVLVALKPIVEGMGLGWESQHNRVKRDPILSQGIVMMNIPSRGGDQESICLPLNMIPGWLMGVDANRVNETIREKVIKYQRECYDVLAAHFLSGGLRTAQFSQIIEQNKQTQFDLKDANQKLDDIKRELKTGSARLQLVTDNSFSMLKTYGEKLDQSFARIDDYAHRQHRIISKVDDDVVALRSRVEQVHPDRGKFGKQTRQRHRFFLLESRAGRCPCGCGVRIVDNLAEIVAGVEIHYHHADKRDSNKRTNCVLMRFECHRRYTLDLEYRAKIDPLITAYRFEFDAWDRRTPKLFYPGQSTLF